MAFKQAVPVPPSLENWDFIKELSQPETRVVKWTRKRPKKNEVDLSGGITLEKNFVDKGGLLETAYIDFERFLDEASIPRKGNYRIISEYAETELHEAFRIEVGRETCRILAADTEGVRRGIFFLEDEILRMQGPFLPLKSFERKPFINTRISRCFYGPIKREPDFRDELLDSIDYYPEEYLNRLAREGSNAVWISVSFKELCKTSVIPEYGQSPEAGRRLDKLRAVAARCRCYGIKVYLFGVEPGLVDTQLPSVRNNPGIIGVRTSRGKACICVSTPSGRKYLEEALFFLFTAVPDLGGYINISVGEKLTHCYSAGMTTTCPHCAKRSPEAVLNDSLEAMRRGMSTASPEAELICWPYTQFSCWGEKETEKYAGHVPEKVTIQYNFESAGEKVELGKKHRITDYLLSYIGPSEHFKRCARNAVGSGARISAKLQIGNSHEVATVPFVPVPGNIYEKFKAMHGLGVSGYMGCWFFGSCPSIMTKAAAELSFEPFPASEDEFLLRLAQIYWGKNAKKVLVAWKCFQKGYNNYPVNSLVGYYGPMQDGPVWPLHLKTVNLPLIPTWKLKAYESNEYLPPAGDRVGEFISHDYSVENILALFGLMNKYWRRGLKIMLELRRDYPDNPGRLRDIGVAEALGLQFKSGLNITRFYALREQLHTANRKRKTDIFKQMKSIVKDEMEADIKLLALCRADSRLGYHGEAEGHKYYPAKIEWRMRQLRHLLDHEFPEAEKAVCNHEPEVSPATEKNAYHCRPVHPAPEMDGKPFGGVWGKLDSAECLWNAAHMKNNTYTMLDGDFSPGCRTNWKACHTAEHLYIGIRCIEPEPAKTIDDFVRLGDSDLVELQLEPRSLWPAFRFYITPGGKTTQRVCTEEIWESSVAKDDDCWSAIVRIPIKELKKYGFNGKDMRLNITRSKPGSTEDCWIIQQCWHPKKMIFSRLLYNADDPSANFGTMCF